MIEASLRLGWQSEITIATGGGAETARHSRTIVRTAFPGIHPAWLSP